MKIIRPMLALLLAGSLISCEKEEPAELIIKDKVEGYVQKGPFINGTSIVISELDGKLIPTGRNFNTQIADNTGNFKINNVALSSRYVELKADGYYFNEVSGTPSSAPLTLYALSDLSDKSSINVNILSYLEKARIEHLIGEGMSFNEAKSKALKEVLAVFNIQNSSALQSETLDISKAGDNNAILLAVSVILQGQRSVAELSELLANFSTDIRQDGIMNSSSLGSKLINDVKYMDMARVRANISKRYADMGMEVSIPDFEKHVRNFIENTKFVYNSGSTYPATGNHGTNFLALANNATVNPSGSYSFSAQVPTGSSLKIVLKGISGQWFTGSDVLGWQLGTYDSETKTQTFTALKTGEVIDLYFALSEVGSCMVEFYENGSPQPSFVKTVSWEQQAAPASRYPSRGEYGSNILSMLNDSTIVANQYSLKMNIPTNEEFAGEIKLIFEGSGSYTLDQAKIQNWQHTQSGNQLTLRYPKGATTADMAVNLSGTGTITIQSPDMSKVIHWK